ncbi:MAG: DUF1972 domain-containing protein [Lachnospiraceae bacterium]|nr:DUF1972 domain-containing protein [Lachnospiraceae bacterium]
MTDVFLIASKGIPARYGGFETFVERLVRGRTTDQIKYHVSCMASKEELKKPEHFEYQGADCFRVKVPLPGAPGRILHVSMALSEIAGWKKEHPDSDMVVYILGCRIGPLMKYHAGILRRLGCRIYVNPDGLEWKRAKWNMAAKRFLHYCEGCLVKNADLVICDAKAIERYIKKTYGSRVKRTVYLAYGADINEDADAHQGYGEDLRQKQEQAGDSWLQWCKEKGIRENGYYLIVGRFVPDNNYETVIREFMKSDSKRDLVIISNIEKNKFYEQLKQNTGFEQDPRIKFAGTVYDEQLLSAIRKNAFAYFHGHEVGGTNPSLLEALAVTDLNLVLDVEFGKEVAGDAALYWSKKDGDLKRLIGQAEKLPQEEILSLGRKAKERIRRYYSWEKLVQDYERLFTEDRIDL